MVRTLSSSAVRAKFSDTLNSVYYTKEPVVVEKQGKPIAVLVNPELFQRLQAEDARDWATIEEVATRNAEQDPASIIAAVTAEVEAVRRQAPRSRGTG